MSGTNQTALTESLEALLQTIWTDETYRPFYDEAYCLNQNVTYSNRVDAESERLVVQRVAAVRERA